MLRTKLNFVSIFWILLFAAWNIFLLAESNKLENVQRKLESLFYSRFIQSCFPHSCNSLLNHLNFRTRYSIWQHPSASFVVNVFKDKITCYSVVNTVRLHIPTEQIRDISTCNVHNVSRLGLSWRWKEQLHISV